MTSPTRVTLHALILIPCLLAVACGGGVTTSGANGKEFVPLEEGFVWQYTNADYGDVYEVWSAGDLDVDGETFSVYRWKFADTQALALDENEAEPGLFYMQTLWSKDDEGVQFHGSVADDGTGHDDTPWSETVYDNPLLFVGVNIYAGDMDETGSNAETWTTEYVESVESLTTDAGTYDNVMHLRFTEANDASPFSGDYWLARQTGIVQFQVAQHPDDIWTLKKIIF